MNRSCLLAGALLVAGCAAEPGDFNRAPAVSPVGSGVATQPVPSPLAVVPASAPQHPASLWSTTSRSLFGDQRARHVGDTLTVLVALDDEAEFDNRSDRSRESTIGFGLGATIEKLGFDTGLVVADVGSTSDSTGSGSTERSDELDTAMTAIVTAVLPNGNLMISGSQETRVNYELRIVNVAGIVRPIDVSKDNTIPYEKIAEARLTYGGRGRLSEVQQPAWGQQLYDMVIPF